MGYRVRELRRERSLTQNQLAEKANVSRITIINIENGTAKSVLSTTLIGIADALGVTVDDLID